MITLKSVFNFNSDEEIVQTLSMFCLLCYTNRRAIWCNAILDLVETGNGKHREMPVQDDEH